MIAKAIMTIITKTKPIIATLPIFCADCANSGMFVVAAIAKRMTAAMTSPKSKIITSLPLLIRFNLNPIIKIFVYNVLQSWVFSVKMLLKDLASASFSEKALPLEVSQ